MSVSTQQFAVVTGGTSGIGLELARQFLQHGYDVLIAADQPASDDALNGAGTIETLMVDLATYNGVQTLYNHIRQSGRRVDALAANAGIGLGRGFFDQERDDWAKVIDTNVTGTLDLVQLIGRDMRAAGGGKILITSSVASQMPGAFNAVYNASKAFLQSFSFAIRNELKDSGVSVTALLPGPTETEFFDRAGMEDTKVGQQEKDDPAAVAKTGFEALMSGKGDVVYGMKNKMQAASAKFIPDDTLAEMHRNMAEPGTGKPAE